MPEITKEDLLNIHPGIIIREDYLPDLQEAGITRYRLAKRLRITQSHLDELLVGKRNVTANIALRLGRLFSQTPQMWLGLQNAYDLKLAALDYGDEVNLIEPLPVPSMSGPDRELAVA